MKNPLFKKIIFILLVTASTLASAQRPGKVIRQQGNKEDIESMKIAFITQQVELTPDEAQKFWPLYKLYNDRLKEFRKKRRQDGRDVKQNLNQLSDKDIEQAIDNDFAMKQKELDLQKEYNIKFKTILPVKKVALFYKAEEEFKSVLINKLKDRTPAKE